MTSTALPNSKRVATCGQQLLAYSRLWNGARPATVVNDFGVDPVNPNSINNVFNVTVMLDPLNDRDVIARLCERPEGSTLYSVRAYEPLTSIQRADVLQHSNFVIEWPQPFVIFKGDGGPCTRSFQPAIESRSDRPSPDAAYATAAEQNADDPSLARDRQPSIEDRRDRERAASRSGAHVLEEQAATNQDAGDEQLATSGAINA